MKTEMTEDSNVQAAQFVKDFITLQLYISAQTSSEMAKIRNVIDQMPLKRANKRYNGHIIVHRMMALMYPNNKPTMGEISKAIDLPLSTTTTVMDYLVKNGHCKRLADRNDRRIVRVVLTEAGRKNLEMGNKFIAERGHIILSALTQEEQCAFLELIHKISEFITREDVD